MNQNTHNSLNIFIRTNTHEETDACHKNDTA